MSPKEIGINLLTRSIFYNVTIFVIWPVREATERNTNPFQEFMGGSRTGAVIRM
jgi:hypothetical protein